MPLHKNISNIVVQKYVCPNPNCGKAFSRPKIIKYCVCPTCQTLVDLPLDQTNLSLPEENKTVKRQIMNEGVEEVQVECRCQESEPLFLDNQPIIELVRESVNESEHEPEQIKVEQLTTVKTEIVACPGKEDITFTDLSFARKHSETETQESISSSDSNCQYYFGYLSQREKGANIPDTCITCPKSLDCMLSKYHSSEEAVGEIKKWYHI